MTGQPARATNFPYEQVRKIKGPVLSRGPSEAKTRFQRERAGEPLKKSPYRNRTRATSYTRLDYSTDTHCPTDKT